MAEFKKWISYLYAYSGEVKGKNVGFARVEVREGRCRLAIGVKGAYGCDEKGLQVGLYIRKEGSLRRIPVGHIQIREGCGEWEQMTPGDNLFGTGIALRDSGGLWLTCEGREILYLASWEKQCLDVREFLPAVMQKGEKEQEEGQRKMMKEEAWRGETQKEQRNEETVTNDVKTQDTQRSAQERLEKLPQPSLWESFSRYYPRTAPSLQQQGVELLQIRPTDIRYLPRQLWYYGSNSFLLHGYYHYKYLVLGRISSEEGQRYLLGVPGVWEEREGFSARMFGFSQFLPVQGRQGYWYTQIHL